MGYTPNDPTNIDWDRVQGAPKRRAQTCPKSVIAAIHKIVKREGLPFYSQKKRGRYHFSGGYDGEPQVGYHATKVGCSRSVAIRWSDSDPRSPRGINGERERELRALLEREGFTFEAPDRNWILCEQYDID